MSDIHWEKIPVNKRKQMTAKLADAAGKIIRGNGSRARNAGSRKHRS